MKYIYIAIYLLTHDLSELKKYWAKEALEKEKFSWLKWCHQLTRYRYRYILLWRLANFMHQENSIFYKRVARQINKSLDAKYKIDVSIENEVGIGFRIPHLVGVVIGRGNTFGKNFTIYQNCVIDMGEKQFKDNVTIYSNSVVTGNKITIGNNVTIGALSFINKDVPDGCTVFSEKILNVKSKNESD